MAPSRITLVMYCPMVALRVFTIPSSTPARGRPCDVAEPAHDRDDEREGGELEAGVDRQRPAHRLRDRHDPRQRSSAKTTVRTEDGLMPTSRAPVSSWITERMPRPNVVAPRNTSSTAPPLRVITEAQKLPTANGTPRIEIGSLPMLMYSAPR